MFVISKGLHFSSVLLLVLKWRQTVKTLSLTALWLEQLTASITKMCLDIHWSSCLFTVVAEPWFCVLDSDSEEKKGNRFVSHRPVSAHLNNLLHLIVYSSKSIWENVMHNFFLHNKSMELQNRCKAWMQRSSMLISDSMIEPAVALTSPGLSVFIPPSPLPSFLLLLFVHLCMQPKLRSFDWTFLKFYKVK